MNTFRAIGFDLGETLLQYEGIPPSWSSLYSQALQAVAATCGASPTPDMMASAEEILSRHNTRLVPRTQEVNSDIILGSILETWNLNPTQYLPAATENFFGFFRRQVSCYADVLPLLMKLRDHSVPFGVLTDVPYGMPGSFVQRDLESAQISGLVEVVLTSVAVGVRKPEPAGYLALAVCLGVLPGQMLYVGNEPKDILGAHRAGVAAALIDRDHSGANYGQDYTIYSLEDLHEAEYLTENESHQCSG